MDRIKKFVTEHKTEVIIASVVVVGTVVVAAVIKDRNSIKAALDLTAESIENLGLMDKVTSEMGRIAALQA